MAYVAVGAIAPLMPKAATSTALPFATRGVLPSKVAAPSIQQALPAKSVVQQAVMSSRAVPSYLPAQLAPTPTNLAQPLPSYMPAQLAPTPTNLAQPLPSYVPAQLAPTPTNLAQPLPSYMPAPTQPVSPSQPWLHLQAKPAPTLAHTPQSLVPHKKKAHPSAPTPSYHAPLFAMPHGPIMPSPNLDPYAAPSYVSVLLPGTSDTPAVQLGPTPGLPAQPVPTEPSSMGSLAVVGILALLILGGGYLIYKQAKG